MKKMILMSVAVTALAACNTGGQTEASSAANAAEQNEAKEPAATSLFGEPLYAPAPSEDMLQKYEAAKAEYEADPGDPDKLIWYGRRTAYLGDYQKAIDIFSEGVAKHPQDARMLRHRGHRYISTRQFDKAIADLEKAAELIEGTADEIEPDGMPNARNIPLTTLHGNIRYHLGLAYYLVQDWENARRVYAEDLASTQNDDGIVASTHWLYMILRRMGREEEANAILEDISADMEIIENNAYHRACLFYKGEISYEDALAETGDSVMGAGFAYGVANWNLYNDRKDQAFELMNRIVDGPAWAAFGYIAAEADLAAYDARAK